MAQNFSVVVNRNESRRELINLFSFEIKRGTSGVATPALYTKFGIDFRISKAFGVASHSNCVFGANIRASLATATICAVGNNHFLNLHHASPPKNFSNGFIPNASDKNWKARALSTGKTSSRRVKSICIGSAGVNLSPKPNNLRKENKRGSFLLRSPFRTKGRLNKVENAMP